MDERLFVISDLHLGGRPEDASGPGFQICSPEGLERLAAFVTWTGTHRTSERGVHLVLAGDIVDFLAEEEPFEPFTADDGRARRKLSRAMNRTSPFWDALSAFVAGGNELTLMLGNHDIELALPGPRAELLQRLGRERHERWKVELLDDNRAFVRGALLIEHGNRYDEWNAVPHDVLRQARSAASRRETPPAVPLIPGSELVARVMNPLKEKYGFVDLLKPENEAALPLLAVLEPAALGQLEQIWALRQKARRNRFDAHGAPVDPANIGAPAMDPEKQLLRLARELTSGDAASIGVLGGVQQRTREAVRRALFRALRALAQHHYQAFHVGQEAETYLRPARAAEERGFQAIIFGHTHLARRVALPHGGRYLNTGTWADVMRLPRAVLEGQESAGLEELHLFMDGLERNQLGAWRKQLPTFAQVDFSAGNLVGSDVRVFHCEPARSEPLPEGSLWEVWDRYA